MRSEFGQPEAPALLDELGAVLTKLSATDLTALSGQQLIDFAREWERVQRAGAVVTHAAVAELESRHVVTEKGASTTAALLVELLRLDPGVARRRVRDAADFGPRRGLNGEPLPALFPQTSRALEAGEISVEHARAISDLFAAIPAQSAEDEQMIEAAAMDAAAVCGPHRLRQWCVLAASRIDPDGGQPNDEAKRRDRSVSVIDLPDGWAKLTGRLSPHAAAALRAVLGPLSAPVPAEHGARDERTPAQRRHDGLEDACVRLLRSGTLPDSGGATTTVLITIGYRDLLDCINRTGHGPGNRASGDTTTGGDVDVSSGTGTSGGGGRATTSYGTLIPIAELLRLAADAQLIPVVLNDAGGIMGYGRARRLATAAQRRALAARDGGCVRPGCTVPAEWCEVHHVTAWQDGGGTDLSNMALVCPHHHRQLDHGARITMRTGDPPAGGGIAGEGGVPHWIEPDYLDPRRTPRRNTAHHIPRIFTEVADVSAGEPAHDP